MTRYRIESAEEGTPTVDTLLDAGYEPFSVVSTPVMEPIMERIGGIALRTDRDKVSGYVNVIWFRLAVPA